MLLMKLVERDLVPDPVIRWGIRRLLARRLLQEKSKADTHADPVARFMQELAASPVAINTKDANEQHYEVPTDFSCGSSGPI